MFLMDSLMWELEMTIRSSATFTYATAIACGLPVGPTVAKPIALDSINFLSPGEIIVTNLSKNG